MQQQPPDGVWPFWCLSSYLSGLASLSAEWHLCISPLHLFISTDPLLFSLFKFQSRISLALPSPSLESGFPGLGKAVFLGGGYCWGQGSFPETCRYSLQSHCAGPHPGPALASMFMVFCWLDVMNRQEQILSDWSCLRYSKEKAQPKFQVRLWSATGTGVRMDLAAGVVAGWAVKTPPMSNTGGPSGAVSSGLKRSGTEKTKWRVYGCL